MAGNGSGYKATAWAWEQALPPSQKLVLLNLAGRADQAFSCFPSLPTICGDTNLSRSTVLRALAALEAADLVFRATRHRKNGSQRSNRYYLSHPDAPHVTGIGDEDERRVAELYQASRRAIEAQGGVSP